MYRQMFSAHCILVQIMLTFMLQRSVSMVLELYMLNNVCILILCQSHIIDVMIPMYHPSAPPMPTHVQINFLLGSDGEPWVWVMGEHPDDLPYQELVRGWAG